MIKISVKRLPNIYDTSIESTQSIETINSQKKNYKNEINNIKFNKRKLTIISKDGKQIIYYFIVIENNKNFNMKITSYSRYLIFELINRKPETLDYHAKIIVSFLNYIFFDNYERYNMVDITDLKKEYAEEYLRDYASGKIGKKNKTDETILKVKEVLNRFYRYLYFNEYGDKMNFISNDDFKIVGINKIKNNNKIKEKYIYEDLFYVTLPNYTPVNRIKSISINLFRRILDKYRKCYPNLVLGICLQAFAGLRASEVCNVTKSKISYTKMEDSFKFFTIDLRIKTQMRYDMVDVGGIKKGRIQPVHPIFLDVLKTIYDNHMYMIENIDNDFGAIFFNRYGEAITYETYSKTFKKVIDIVKVELSQEKDDESASELNILMSGYIGTHVFRHFFTQFIAKLEETKSSSEIAYWRGDSNLDSSIRYLANAYYIDSEILAMQEKMLKAMLE